MPGTLADRLPPFPWDRLAPYAQKADAHPGGRVDLSVGTPVDPVPAAVRTALIEAADWPGYPVTRGTDALREGALGWMRRVLGVGLEGTAQPGVLPVIGSKELVAGMPTLLALGPGDRVAYPVPAYPTYEIGALLTGSEPVPTPFGRLPEGAPPKLVWLNSPANPHGQVLTVGEMRAAVAWAREHGAVVVSDECYITLGWDEAAKPVSILHPDVCDGDFTGLLALHSLSKRSNLAGYRAAFLAGDPQLLKDLLLVRMHGGMIMPGPVQAAMAAALNDDEHAAEQKERYRARRVALRGALERAGFRIDHSQAGLYLWATRDEPCWDTIGSLAELGILAAPGEIYGPAGGRHVRLALTATDERIAAAVERLG
ncbi:MAG TPA: succinyldiaminopimelate transaminase [Actinospica sp.]|nr:succinyldiaminopimelate transaminase [Actinospica sp.]